jgi:hypothetical protein
MAKSLYVQKHSGSERDSSAYPYIIIMLVVLDTNIIISGLYSKRGASYQLLKAAISGDLPCAISPLIALEYEGKIHDIYAPPSEGTSRQNKRRGKAE